MLHANTCATLAAGLLAVLASPSAIAGDNWSSYDHTHMTGAQCQPSTGSQWPDFLVNPNGIRNNNATSNRYVSCTIPFNSEEAISQSDSDPTTAQGPMRVVLTLDYSQVGATSNYSTDCTLFGQNGSTVQSDTQSVQSTKTTDFVYIDFGTSAALEGVSISNHATSVSLNCRLPPKVKLVTIKTYEYGDTGNYRYTP